MKHKGISNTAAYIAIKFYGLLLNEQIGKLFDPRIKAFYGDLVRYLPGSLSWYHKALSHPVWRKIFVTSEELLLPGDLMHIVSRKYYLDRLVQKAVDQGCRQIVVPGAGFDHTAALFAQQGITCFEIDLPEMINEKKKFLTENDLLNDRLHLVSGDLTQHSFGDLLFPLGLDTDQPVHILAEGFFDYIPLQAAEDLLQDMLSLSQEISLSSTLFSLNELNPFHRASFTWGVAMVGEAIKLPLEMGGFEELLSSYGFNITDRISHDQMKEELIAPTGLKEGVLKGFYVFSAALSAGGSSV